MDAKKLSYAGLVTVGLTLLPIVQNLVFKEVMAVLTLILGIAARVKGDKHGGLIILIIGIYLIITTIFADYMFYLLQSAT
ncbi:MAG: hypothetical protein AABX70_02745 [Nanoarchaeota archaeon]